MDLASGFSPSADLLRILLPVIFACATASQDLCPADARTWRNNATVTPAVSTAIRGSERPPSQDAPIAIRFDLHRKFLIVVEGAIGDLDRLTMVIDTGHHESTIDLRIARELGLEASPAQLKAFGRRITAERVIVPWLKVGPLKTLDLPVLVTDLRRAGNALGLQADAIVGLDVLLGTCISVDYPRRTLTFGRLDAWDFSIDLDTLSRYPIINPTIDGISYRLLVDTGAEMILLFRGAVPARHRITFDGEISADHLAGTATLRRFTAGRLRLGNFQSSRVPIFVAPGGEKLGYDGLLGPHWLTSTRLQLDLERMVLSWDT
jgi:predicted aspartyl protease